MHYTPTAPTPTCLSFSDVDIRKSTLAFKISVIYKSVLQYQIPVQNGQIRSFSDSRVLLLTYVLTYRKNTEKEITSQND